MFLLRNYQLICICPVEVWCSFKQIFMWAVKLWEQINYASFKNIEVLRGNNWINSFETLNTGLSLLFTTKLSSIPQFKTHIKLLSTFVDERSESQKKKNFKMKTDKNLRSADQSIFNFFFFTPACLQKKFHRRALSICAFSFDGTNVLWEDSVSLLMKSWALLHHVINLSQ